MRDMVCIAGLCVKLCVLWVKFISNDRADLACAIVRDSRSEPGGGVPVLYPEMGGGSSGMVGDALGTSLGGFVCMLLHILGAGGGGGSGGGNATVHATEGGGTTAVGPRPRHSLLVISAVVEGVSIVSIVRSVRESYSHTVQSIWQSISANVKS